MSKKDKVTEKPDQKVVTKYDQKLQKRKELEAKEKRQDMISRMVGIVVVVALLALVASFPLRTWLATNETFVTVGGDKVTRVEFDYNYNLSKSNYVAQYGSYMSYFGLNMDGDLSTQMYSETLSWQDYFEQLAIENIIKNKAILAEAKAAGFTYDTKKEYDDYEATMKELAQEQGTGFDKFLKASYGKYATLGRLSGYIKDGIIANAYYNSVSDEKSPADDEIQTYYDENKAEYDSVDYKIIEAVAQLPTEPTELADKAEDNGDAEGEGTDASGEDTPYEPSEAEIKAAMEEAKKQADEDVKKVAETGKPVENVTKSTATSVTREWLFDSARKAGDTTVIEDSTANKYYVLAFEKRYLDETPSVDVRVIVSDATQAQVMLDEWKAGAATEDSFIELCKKYSEDTMTKDEGGLYEAVLPSGMDPALSDWLFEEGRAQGDTTAVTTESGSNYVMYYVGQNQPQWKLSIKNTLLSETMSKYLEEITKEGFEVSDSKGNLNYLKVEALEASKEASSQAADQETGESQEGSSQETSAESESSTAQSE